MVFVTTLLGYSLLQGLHQQGQDCLLLCAESEPRFTQPLSDTFTWDVVSIIHEPNSLSPPLPFPHKVRSFILPETRGYSESRQPRYLTSKLWGYNFRPC